MGCGCSARKLSTSTLMPQTVASFNHRHPFPPLVDYAAFMWPNCYHVHINTIHCACVEADHMPFYNQFRLTAAELTASQILISYAKYKQTKSFIRVDIRNGRFLIDPASIKKSELLIVAIEGLVKDIKWSDRSLVWPKLQKHLILHFLSCNSLIS